MWPWSKIKKLEQRVVELRKALDVANLDNNLLRDQIHKLTNRDAKGRFKRK